MLRSKWEEEIVRYAGEHHEAYPTFSEFLAMIQDEARKRNHPYVSAGVSTANGMRKVLIARRIERSPRSNATWCRGQAAAEDQYRTR